MENKYLETVTTIYENYNRERLSYFLPPINNNSRKRRPHTSKFEGGYHASFGHYEPQKRNGIRAIPMEEQ
jgi:hypothetical protein